MRSVRARHVGVAALAVMAVLFSLTAAAWSQSRTYSLDAYPYPNAIPLQQFRSVLAREPRLAARWNAVPCRGGAPALACAADQAEKLERRLQDLPAERQVAGVYAYYNRFHYQHRRGCGADCWATPLEFIARRAGDCHDYVVAEYFALRRLGFNEDSLQLVIVQMKGYDDPFAGGHLVLRVRLPDRDVVLDNRKEKLTGLSGLKDYRVLAGLNARSIQVYSRPAVAPAPAREPRPHQALTVSRRGSSPGENARCLQSATLADWNSNLPCTPVINTPRLQIPANNAM